MALALADRAEPGDGTAGRMNANFTGIEHAEAENVAILDRPSANYLGEEADADPHKLARFAAGEGFAVALLLLAQASAAPPPDSDGRIRERRAFLPSRYRVEARYNLGSAVARALPYRRRARGRVRIRRPALSLAERDCREDHRGTLVGSPVFWREQAGTKAGCAGTRFMMTSGSPARRSIGRERIRDKIA